MKKLFCIVCAIVMAIGLTACSSKESDTDTFEEVLHDTYVFNALADGAPEIARDYLESEAKVLLNIEGEKDGKNIKFTYWDGSKGDYCDGKISVAWVMYMAELHPEYLTPGLLEITEESA